MKEVIIVSGKGGTGKTSLIGSLAELAENKVLVDCDVDAADLHLLLAPTIIAEHDFIAGVKATVLAESCNSCGLCEELCQFGAVTMNQQALINEMSCEGCGVCAHFCPEQAIKLHDHHCGHWFQSQTKYGPLVHAQLMPGEENSGKLVTKIKQEARQLAEAQGLDLLLVDGSPGIGCPVIASLSNADMIVAVTEPTLSGWHDLERLLDLADHFRIQSLVCINKWDLHSEMSQEIEDACKKRGTEILGRIPFDRTVVDSQIQGIPVVCHNDSHAASAIRDIWEKLSVRIKESPADSVPPHLQTLG
ncbi:MAG: 4Fe-4S binding protein [Desulfobulbaceae bacterium]|uniref:4Fe-4S binding protein n=1 Tax=Candidatus Desulfatifera sulfidica TaxID=2841691 RepID=A0A8J6TA38_9BACT|nr:4Fe-4S binding protein [Candidatus Desulfatifera sulfidica]